MSAFQFLGQFHSQEELGWFSQVASKLRSLFKTHNFTVKYEVVTRAVFANLLQFEMVPEEKVWGQVAFPSRKNKDTSERSHGHCCISAGVKAIFVWVPCVLPVQKALLPTWFCFHCKSVLALLKTLILLSFPYNIANIFKTLFSIPLAKIS